MNIIEIIVHHKDKSSGPANIPRLPRKDQYHRICGITPLEMVFPERSHHYGKRINPLLDARTTRVIYPYERSHIQA